MPVTVVINPHVLTQPQSFVIPNASSGNDGCMSAVQAAQLAALVGGGSGGGGATTFSTFLAFPLPAPQGMFAVAADTNLLYWGNNGNWYPIAVGA